VLHHLTAWPSPGNFLSSKKWGFGRKPGESNELVVHQTLLNEKYAQVKWGIISCKGSGWKKTYLRNQHQNSSFTCFLLEVAGFNDLILQNYAQLEGNNILSFFFLTSMIHKSIDTDTLDSTKFSILSLTKMVVSLYLPKTNSSSLENRTKHKRKFILPASFRCKLAVSFREGEFLHVFKLCLSSEGRSIRLHKALIVQVEVNRDHAIGPSSLLWPPGGVGWIRSFDPISKAKLNGHFYNYLRILLYVLHIALP